LKVSSNRRTDVELCLITLCVPTLDGSAAGLAARVARLEQGGVVMAPPVQEQAAEVKSQPVSVEKPAPAAKPAEEAKPVEMKPVTEAPKAAPAAGRWPGWPVVRDRLKAVMPVSDFSFLGNSAMVDGSWDGQTVTLWAVNDFIRGMLDKPAVTTPVAKTVSRIVGGTVRVEVKVGNAPREVIAPPPAEEEDALEAFLADAGDNIIVE